MARDDEVKQVLYGYLQAGLIDNDPEQVLSYLTDDIIGFGMGEQGFVCSKSGIRDLILAGTRPHVQTSYALEYENIAIRYHSDTVATLCAKVSIKCCRDGHTARSGLMQSLTLRLEGDTWRIAALHASPVILSEESISAYPLRYAESTLALLRAELQQQTLDLMNQSISGGILSCYRQNGVHPLYFVNDSLLESLGYTREQFTQRYGAEALEVIHPDDRAMVVSTIRDAIKNGRDFSIRPKLLKRDGGVCWMTAQGRLSTDENGSEVLIGVFMDVTEMVEMQERLERQAQALEAQAKELAVSEERFRIALEKTSNIIFDYDIISGNIMHSSIPKKSTNFVTSIQEAPETLIIGGRILDGYLEEFYKTFSAVRSGAPQASCIVKSRLTTGKEIWNRISLSGITDGKGKTVRAVGMIEDITRQKEAEIAFAREEQYRQAILADALASYIINFTRGIIETGRIASDACIPITPGDPYDTVIYEESRARLNESDRRTFLNLFCSAAVMERYQRGEVEHSLEYCSLNPDGTDMWMRTTMHVVQDVTTNEIKGFMYVTDIDKQKREELELTRRTELDPMTGLYNKSAAITRISEMLKTYEGIQSGVFMMVDVDYFKDVNDRYGHPFGDQILVGIARVLRDNFREHDIVGRLGGDEFCVFLCGMRSRERVLQSAQAIREGVEKLTGPHEGKKNVTCSIGIASCAGVSKTFPQIYQEADRALYMVKEHGRDGCAFYDDAPEPSEYQI